MAQNPRSFAAQGMLGAPIQRATPVGPRNRLFEGLEKAANIGLQAAAGGFGGGVQSALMGKIFGSRNPELQAAAQDNQMLKDRLWVQKNWNKDVMGGG